jgi:histidine triad (HIT) family protein
VVEDKQKEDCVFCKIVRGEIKAQIISDEENFIVFKDANPISEGHCLIVPKNHYETILDMPSTLGTELLSIAKKQGLRLIKEKKAEGFNLIQNNFTSAGQVVMHSHFHIIPRKDKDGLKFLVK